MCNDDEITYLKKAILNGKMPGIKVYKLSIKNKKESNS